VQAGDSECLILFSGDAANSCEPCRLSLLAILVVCERKCSIPKPRREAMAGVTKGRQSGSGQGGVSLRKLKMLILIGYIWEFEPQPQPSSNNQTVSQTTASGFFRLFEKWQLACLFV